MSTQSLKDEALDRISTIVDKVFEDSEVYREEVDKDQFMQHISKQFNNGLLPEKVVSISKERLTRIVRQHLAIDVLSGLLSDLTPEEMEIFNAAVEGR
jgi:DNA-binding NarL/FixJ family response regulator